MDIQNIIVSTLALAVARIADETVRHAYQAVKTKILEKLKENPRIGTILDGFAEEPDTWERPLAKSLDEANADQDLEIMAAVKELRCALKLEELPDTSITINSNINARDITGSTVISGVSRSQITTGSKDKQEGS